MYELMYESIYYMYVFVCAFDCEGGVKVLWGKLCVCRQTVAGILMWETIVARWHAERESERER